MTTKFIKGGLLNTTQLQNLSGKKWKKGGILNAKQLNELSSSSGDDEKKITISIDSINKETFAMTSSTDLTSEEAKNIYADYISYKDSDDPAGLNRYLNNLFFILDMSKSQLLEGLDEIKNTMWTNVESSASGNIYWVTITGSARFTSPLPLGFSITIYENGEVTTSVYINEA